MSVCDVQLQPPLAQRGKKSRPDESGSAFQHVLLSTGNIAQTATRTTTGSRDELLQSLEHTLTSSTPIQLQEPNSNVPILTIGNTTSSDILAEDRTDLDITIKLFIPSHPTPSHVHQTLTHLTTSLQTTTIDTVIVYWPASSSSLLKLLPLWRELERYVKEGKIANLGVSGFTGADQLRAWNQLVEIKPTKVQVRTEAGTLRVAPEIMKLSLTEGFELYLDTDPDDILSHRTLQRVTDIHSLPVVIHPSWIARYQVVVKTRQVLLSRGYV
ncbi:hypothetical protein HK097_007444 [Rhizophlyctis rosea]|uniref:GCS light chain n=1 Tax=Rhizophlyctis rosea TaxID=64517 RepID=A0AAD5X284_9FUNG|nr:hypothetical protein HK097_007444 [Rhizophlyctis rosea]